MIVKSIMTYGSEIWVTNKIIMDNIRAVEVEYWSYEVTRLDKIISEEIKR